MERQAHSGLGIASFATGVASIVLLLALFALIAVIEDANPGTMDGTNTVSALAGYFLSALWIAELVACGLGIGALLKGDASPLFPILGILVAMAGLVLSVGVVLLGLAIG